MNLLLLLISLLIFVASCASVPNVPLCAEINLGKGTCTYTVTGVNVIVDDEHPLDGLTWFDIRSRALTVPATSWAKLKAFLIKMCKQNKCDTDISSWDRDLNP